MSNVEFQQRLESMYNKYSMITKGKKKTVNELFYVLRMDDVDYNISVCEGKKWICIPSIKECFVPVQTLAKYVKDVYIDEVDFDCEEICLTVEVE